MAAATSIEMQKPTSFWSEYQIFNSDETSIFASRTWTIKKGSNKILSLLSRGANLTWQKR
jgi:hypothetical protein